MNKHESWEAWAISKYGSIEEARQIRSEAGKKAKGVTKRTVFQDDPERAKEVGKLGAKARWKK